MNMFFGVIFVVVGLSLIFNSLFHIDLPILRICLAIFILYIGVKMLFGSFGMHFNHNVPEGTVLFKSSEFKFPPDDWDQQGKTEYNAIFGSSVIDLRGIQLFEKDISIKINAVFGEVEVLINQETPIEVRTQTVFGSARFPDKESSSFGNFNYTSSSAKEAQYKVILKTDVVFGSLKITVLP